VENIAVSKSILYLPLCFSLSLLLSSCGFEETNTTPSEKAYSKLSTNVRFYAYPNDANPGDSVLSQLPYGVLGNIQPLGEYEIEIAGSLSQPQLHIYGLDGTSIQRSGQTIEFTQTSPNIWKASWTAPTTTSRQNVLLLTDGTNRSSKPTSWKWTGQGKNALKLGLQLVLFGKAQSNPNFADSLAQALKTGIQSLWAGSGITVDTILLLNANQHPKYGSLWPNAPTVTLDPVAWQLRWGTAQDSLNLNNISEGMPSTQQRLLQLAVVDYIEASQAIIGVSPFHGVSLGQGQGSTAAVGYYAKSGSKLTPNPPSEIANTLAHELGHFLGLRHTTVHFDQRTDQSILEDGLTDTPYNPACALATAQTIGSLQNAWTKLSAAVTGTCPDKTNLMFPFQLSSGTTQNVLSATQLSTLSHNLSLLPPY
jgi:hypothetical protein